MSYQVIARKWRPLDFNQLVGQTHISQTLVNALKKERLPHALLFTGPRGTGKTSSARILAKSLRCTNAVDFKPCNECRDCIDITNSRSIDVIEIDGASNNGVDDVRELREGVAFMPSSGKFKIYIIDEVHMLSTSAFNALLKTLEEPPEHVIFIMATTEVHKIPNTILSRCQRFDFRRIPTRQIADRLKLICEQEQIAFEPDALWVIARQGDGSLRDSQSLLDQVITFVNGPLAKQSVIDVLGLTDRSLILEILESFKLRDPQLVLPALEKINQKGADPALIIEDLLLTLRNTLLLKISGSDATSNQDNQWLDLPDSEIRHLKEVGRDMTEEDLHFLFDMALKGATDLNRSSEPSLVLEMILLRMCQTPRMESLARLLQSGGLDGRTETQSPARTANPTTTSAQQEPPREHPRAVPKVSANKASQKSGHERWFDFVSEIKSSEALFAAKIENLLFIQESNKSLELGIPTKLGFLGEQLSNAASRQKLQSLIDQYWGPGYSFSLKVVSEPKAGQSAQSVAKERAKQQDDEIKQVVSEHPKVKAATTVFKGQIKSVTALKSAGESDNK